MGPLVQTHSIFSHGVSDFTVGMQPPPPLPFNTVGEGDAFNVVWWLFVWWLLAVAAPLDAFDDCPNAVTFRDQIWHPTVIGGLSLSSFSGICHQL